MIDGPLAGGVPKAIELTALADIADLSIDGLESANNGAASSGAGFTRSGSASAGEHIDIAAAAAGFEAFLGFLPDFVNGSAPNINGDDAIILFASGVAIDTFGAVGTDGTGEPWEYTDSWAYRKAGVTAGSVAGFNIVEWTFGGVDVRDGSLTNAAAPVPFPVGTFAPAASGPVIDEIRIDQTGADADEYFDLSGTPGSALDGLAYIVIGDGAGSSGEIESVTDLGGQTKGADGYFVVTESTVTPGTADPVANRNFENPSSGSQLHRCERKRPRHQ